MTEVSKRYWITLCSFSHHMEIAAICWPTIHIKIGLRLVIERVCTCVHWSLTPSEASTTFLGVLFWTTLSSYSQSNNVSVVHVSRSCRQKQCFRDTCIEVMSPGAMFPWYLYRGHVARCFWVLSFFRHRGLHVPLYLVTLVLAFLWVPKLSQSSLENR